VARLDAFDQWCFRRLLGITWQDHITNTEVRERTGVPAVSETISVKTVHARPRAENATFSRRLQSHLPRHSFGLAEMTW